MKRILLSTALAFALMGNVGCSNSKISPAEGVLLGCDAFASALSSIAPLRADGKLNASVVDAVEKTRASVDPVCEGEAPNVDSSVRDVIVDGGTKALLAIFAAYK